MGSWARHVKHTPPLLALINTTNTRHGIASSPHGHAQLQQPASSVNSKRATSYDTRPRIGPSNNRTPTEKNANALYRNPQQRCKFDSNSKRFRPHNGSAVRVLRFYNRTTPVSGTSQLYFQSNLSPKRDRGSKKESFNSFRSSVPFWGPMNSNSK